MGKRVWSILLTLSSRHPHVHPPTTQFRVMLLLLLWKHWWCDQEKTLRTSNFIATSLFIRIQMAVIMLYHEATFFLSCFHSEAAWHSGAVLRLQALLLFLLMRFVVVPCLRLEVDVCTEERGGKESFIGRFFKLSHGKCCDQQKLKADWKLEFWYTFCT